MPDIESVKLSNRRRTPLGITVHPATLDRLESLCSRFETSRGRIVDKLVLALWTAHNTGKLTCIHGQPCRIDRTDLPDVL